MKIIFVAVGVYLLLAGGLAVWIGKAIAFAAGTPRPSIRIPDTAHEFLEVTR